MHVGVWKLHQRINSVCVLQPWTPAPFQDTSPCLLLDCILFWSACKSIAPLDQMTNQHEVATVPLLACSKTSGNNRCGKWTLMGEVNQCPLDKDAHDFYVIRQFHPFQIQFRKRCWAIFFGIRLAAGYVVDFFATPSLCTHVPFCVGTGNFMSKC